MHKQCCYYFNSCLGCVLFKILGNKISSNHYKYNYIVQLMANFHIETDKNVYFAGDTVNGNIFINVGALIVGAQGLSLKFTGYQCVKWLESRELHRPAPPRHVPGQPPPPPPFDPIAAIPPGQLFDTDNMDISDCESEENNEFDHRPKFIRTSSNRYFEMRYFETRNMFTRNKMMVYQCSGFPPGQYSFPFSFKTFQGWPASFSHHSPQKKGVIIYHMTATIEPITPNFRIQGSRQIIVRETRIVSSQQKQSSGQITSCCCISKGFTSSTMSFAKDGYTPGQLVQILIQIDNSNCTANVSHIQIAISNQVTLRSQGHSTGDSRTIFSKRINGVYAGQTMLADKALREQFVMPSTPDIKPTCSGKLLSSQYTLGIRLYHDISCKCCSDNIGSSISVIIFPNIREYPMPSTFTQNWSPKVMPMINMVLPNNFANFNMGAMGTPNMYPGF